MTKPILYGAAASTFVRTARLAFHEKGVDYALEPIEFGSPEHLALHPFGKIPAMRHGDLVLFESLAITSYVDDVFDGPALFPADPVARARTLKWISVHNDVLFHRISVPIFFERLAKPSFGEATDEARVQAAMPGARHVMEVLEAGLGNDAWFGGDQPSMADWFLAPPFHYAGLMPDVKAMRDGFPRLSAWIGRAEARESFKATQPEMPQAA